MANETVKIDGITIYLNVSDEKTLYDAVHEKTGVRESGGVINYMPGFREKTRQKAIDVSISRIKKKMKLLKKYGSRVKNQHT